MLQLQVRSYRRPFCQPLRTAHGPWSQRQGLILRFEDEQGRTHFGEIAPIPWFGTETLEQAEQFCDRWPRQFSPEWLDRIPPTLPACQFGFSAARGQTTPQYASALSLQSLARYEERDLHSRTSGFPTLTAKDICALLPAGEAALSHWQKLWRAGHRTFKWKIGVAVVDAELRIFQQLVKALPADALLRLDANGGLTPETAAAWLAVCDRAPVTIEFLEQPLPPAQILDWLPQIQGQFATAIALDESVATFQQLQQIYEQVQNQVVYGVKPAIAGWPHQLLDFCRNHPIDVVVSSALETPVGRQQGYQFAQILWANGLPRRALGFGVGHWFADNWEQLSEARVWQHLADT